MEFNHHPRYYSHLFQPRLVNVSFIEKKGLWQSEETSPTNLQLKDVNASKYFILKKPEMTFTSILHFTKSPVRKRALFLGLLCLHFYPSL